MPKRWAIIEIDTLAGRHAHLHVIMVPDFNEAGFYQQGVSFDAFFMGVRRRNWSNGRLYIARRWGQTNDGWDEFNGTMDRQNSFDRPAEQSNRTDDRDLPRTDYPDVWSFYRAVGYDYKKKRYLKQSV